MLGRFLQGVLLCLLLAVGTIVSPLAVRAEISKSNNYQVDESTVGAGGLLQSSSTSYRASSSLSDLAVGEGSSTNYQVQAGSKTTNDPALSFSINTPAADFGEFSPTTAATTTASFSVADYTSYGYSVFIAGDTLANGSSSIAPMTTTGASSPGTDQFGLNLVANTTPKSFGANPVYGLFGVGSATANYATPDQYRYVSGESIASAPKSSGVTTYTISYIANVTSLKLGGQYSTKQTLVVTGTY